MPLEAEIEFFKKKRDEFMKAYPDQFILIKGEEFIGAFTTEAQAYEAGVKKFGNTPFLIKKASDRDEPNANFFALKHGLISARP